MPSCTHAPDLLSLLLTPCQLRSQFVGEARLCPPWGFEFSSPEPAFYLVAEEGCLVESIPEKRIWQLDQHDLAIVTHQRAFRLCDRPGSPLQRAGDFLEICSGAGPRAGAGAARIVGGPIDFGDGCSRRSFDMLPKLLVLRARASGPQVQGLVRLLQSEIERGAPAGGVVRRSLLQILITLALRHQDQDDMGVYQGPLAALDDPGLRAAVEAIHTRPSTRWSVMDLAQVAGHSRSSFAARFADTVGQTPLEYLYFVRMGIACCLLRDTDRGVKEIAVRAGYGSESSFGKAFTRFAGQSPGRFRRESRHLTNHESPYGD